MSWEEYLKHRKIGLSAWQAEAADAILDVLCARAECLTQKGKTFLFETLLDYINKHGNEIRYDDQITPEGGES